MTSRCLSIGNLCPIEEGINVPLPGVQRAAQSSKPGNESRLLCLVSTNEWLHQRPRQLDGPNWRQSPPRTTRSHRGVPVTSSRRGSLPGPTATTVRGRVEPLA